MTERKQVKIRCPECGTIQNAELVHRDGAPWPDYVYECTECNWTITESDWDEITEKPLDNY